MRMICFADVDNNLMQQTTKCPDGLPLKNGSVSKDGVVSSSLTPWQAQLVELLQSGGRLIPVTARDLDALNRIVVPFDDYKVCCHGALILRPDGSPDPEWQDHIAAERPEWEERIRALKESLMEIPEVRNDPRLLFKMGEDNLGKVCFVGLRASEHTVAMLTERKDEFWNHPDALFRANGDDLAFLSPYASKRRAVRFLKQRLLAEHPHTLVIGSGDSMSDLPFIAECHFMLTPTDSQVMNSLKPASGFSME